MHSLLSSTPPTHERCTAAWPTGLSANIRSTARYGRESAVVLRKIITPQGLELSRTGLISEPSTQQWHYHCLVRLQTSLPYATRARLLIGSESSPTQPCTATLASFMLQNEETHHALSTLSSFYSPTTHVAVSFFGQACSRMRISLAKRARLLRWSHPLTQLVVCVLSRDAALRLKVDPAWHLLSEDRSTPELRCGELSPS